MNYFRATVITAIIVGCAAFWIWALVTYGLNVLWTTCAIIVVVWVWLCVKEVLDEVDEWN